MNRVVWAGPASFLAHAIEEILTMESWFRNQAERLPSAVRDVAPLISTELIAATVGVIFISVATMTRVGSRKLEAGRSSKLVSLVALFLFTHGIGHVGAALAVAGFAPGALTSLLLIPYSVFVWNMLGRAHLLPTLRTTVSLTVVTVLVQVVGVGGFIWVGPCFVA